MLYAAITPRDGHVSACVATGGHPLPLVLRADGRVETAGSAGHAAGDRRRPGSDRGGGSSSTPATRSCCSPTGSSEATPSDRAVGPERLAAFLAGCVGAGAAAIAEAVERDAVAVQGGSARDDVAVLVVRAGGDPVAPFGAETVGVATAT